jgi:hypothetical protein
VALEMQAPGDVFQTAPWLGLQSSMVEFQGWQGGWAKPKNGNERSLDLI